MDLTFAGSRRQLVEPFITTVTGTVVQFLNPKPNQIKIFDIAWHLARTCRYGTHVGAWYSNAEHSILCADMTKDFDLARACLIHDAAEYVFGDIPSPVGRLCPEYKRLINQFQEYINIHFLGRPIRYIEKVNVDDIDKRICATEMRDLRQNPDWHLLAEPYPKGEVFFANWDIEEANYRFMKRFEQLFPEYKDVA